MYVGLAFVLSSWGFYLKSPASLLGVVGFILYIYHLQVSPEEQALLKLFGEEYDEYRSGCIVDCDRTMNCCATL
jgi:protein-S-isoprenylcysteine O-methyltransferase Ste14